MYISQIYRPFSDTQMELPESFRSTPEELRSGMRKADFSIDNRTCWKTCKKVALLVLKIILFPWIIYETITWIAQRYAMAALFPAQSALVKLCCSHSLRTPYLDKIRADLPNQFPARYIFRHVPLKLNGVSFSGLLIGTDQTIRNGKWVLQATGNRQPIETAANLAFHYLAIRFNLFMVNGPGAGRSDGIANGKTLGDPQKIAIKYLEHALHAKKIVFAAFSLGSAAISRAIETHKFLLKEKQYLVVRQMGFNSVGNVGRAIFKKNGSCLGPLATCIANWTRLNISTMASSKKLLKLKIPEVIIQANQDPIIPRKASHAYGLKRDGIIHPDLKTFHDLSDSRHHMAIEITVAAIQHWENSLV